MKAAVVTALGSPPSYLDFQDPAPLEGESLVRVSAAGIHPLVKALVRGSHYGTSTELPFVAGVDGVGTLENGQRVYTGFSRKPFGTMAERVPVPSALCIPIPDGLDDATAAACANPGMSGWLALTWRAQLAKGETVVVLGATGVAGKMTVQLAKHLGAGRVIAIGRNPRVLDTLTAIGADVVIALDGSDRAMLAAKLREAAPSGIDVVVDFLWGPPAEATIEAVTRRGLTQAAKRVRYVQVGESAGATITMPAGVLRGSALELTGTGAGTVPISGLFAAIPKVLALVAGGVLTVEVDRVPLADVEKAWSSAGDGRRTVIMI